MNKLMLVPSELDKDQYGGLNFKSASDIPSKHIQWYWSGMIERVALDEMSVDRQNTNETPTRVLWRLPS